MSMQECPNQSTKVYYVYGSGLFPVHENEVGMVRAMKHQRHAAEARAGYMAALVRKPA